MKHRISLRYLVIAKRLLDIIQRLQKDFNDIFMNYYGNFGDVSDS